MSSEDRVKQVSDDVASVLSLLELAQVMDQEESVSSADLKKAQAAQKAAEEKPSNLEVSLGLAKDKLK